MTIIASVKVRDGLILGTDSMTQIWGTFEDGPQLMKHYTNARKLFELRGLPIGVMTYGAGNIGNRSIEGLVYDFGQEYGGTGDVQDAADGLFGFFKEQYDAEFAAVEETQRPVLGMFVGGYSPNEAFAREYEFLLPRDEGAVEVKPPEGLGSTWRGIDAPYTRLAAGIDPSLVADLEEHGINAEQIEEMLAKTRMTVVFDGMPVQDAINYCAYILDTTIGWSQFEWGLQTCARPLQVATVLEDGGFNWITRPDLAVPA